MSSKKFAVVGDPISHSLSPVIHRAAYKHLGLDWSYEAKQVSSGELAFFLDANKGVFSGLSVTMPLKFEAAQLGTTVDNDVRLTAVANTLLIGSNISSFNTDIFGIERALQVVWDTRPQTVAILGSGATARSVLSAFSNKVPDAEVFIYARNLDKAAELADLFSSLQITIALLDSFSGVEDLIVNTLPSAASFTNHFESSEAWLLNVGYSQEKSDFSKLFASEKVIRGEEMLIWQAIQQIRIFSSGDKFAALPNETILYEVMKESIQDHATGVGE